MVGGWGYFLVQGVRDPLGGINSLWPLFGIANQMLAAIALCLGTTIILKLALRNADPQPPGALAPVLVRRPAMALITVIPLAWLLAVTFAAGIQKIWHPDPRIGFLSQARELAAKRPALIAAVEAAEATGNPETLRAAERALRTNGVLRFNNRLDAVVAAAFLGLVSLIVCLSVWEWAKLLGRRKPAVLSETPPVWLPDYAVAETRPANLVGAAGLAVALARELSGEARLDRECAMAHSSGHACHAEPSAPGSAGSQASRAEHYVKLEEARFNGVRRCC
jgi:carbon starvation protein